jgi:hypothetical protein
MSCARARTRVCVCVCVCVCVRVCVSRFLGRVVSVMCGQAGAAARGVVAMRVRPHSTCPP